MGFQIKGDIVMMSFLCYLVSILMVGHCKDTDILCLRSIKDSLEDPYNRLSSWKFDNNTESFICYFVGVECWHIEENKVLNLNLTKMGLKGEFPRGIQNCSSLTGLDFSHNHLTGPIPSDISKLLPFVSTMYLSNNKLNGEIPPSLANCTYLTTLRLDNNMLSGHIPPQFGQLPRIKTVSFANNNLTGQVPLFRSVDSYAYANNTELCGGPLPPCDHESSDGFSESFYKGFAIGYAFWVTSVVVIYISYFAPWEWQHSNSYRRNRAKEFQFRRYIYSIVGRKTTIQPHAEQELQPLHLQQNAIKEISVVTERMKSTMRFNEVRDATECFSIDNAIGMGKMGIMYKGMLPNGWNLAIKRLFDSKQFKKQFLLEIRILGKYRHKNIVPLLGFCSEGKERILVYQYLSNGRLSKWLRPLEGEVKLKWSQKIKIAFGVAKGLSWLHHICDLHVVHLNISSECVLLDKNFEPKISNFGKAKFMNPNIEDSASTTFYVSDGKKDVYDFGSLLFELITGKTLKELLCSSNTTNLSGNPSIFYNAIDESLVGEGFENEAYTLIKIACRCVKPFPDERPTMLEVCNYIIDIWGEQHRSRDDSDALNNISVSSSIIEEIVEL